MLATAMLHHSEEQKSEEKSQQQSLDCSGEEACPALNLESYYELVVSRALSSQLLGFVIQSCSRFLQ